MKKTEITFDQAFEIINGRLGNLKTDVVDRSYFEVNGQEISKAFSEKIKETLDIDVSSLATFYDKRNQPAQVVSLKKVQCYGETEYYVLSSDDNDILCGSDLKDTKCYIIETDGCACVQITTSDKSKSWCGEIRFYPSYETVIENLC